MPNTKKARRKEDRKRKEQESAEAISGLKKNEKLPTTWVLIFQKYGKF